MNIHIRSSHSVPAYTLFTMRYEPRLKEYQTYPQIGAKIVANVATFGDIAPRSPYVNRRFDRTYLLRNDGSYADYAVLYPRICQYL
jgi:hypothetical protein